MAKTYDFDNWTDDDAEAAIARIAEEQTRFRYLIDGDDLVIELPGKNLAKLPLTINTEDLLAVMEIEDGEAVMLIRLLDRLGEKDASAHLQGANVALLAKIAMVYFDLIGKITGVAVGE